MKKIATPINTAEAKSTKFEIQGESLHPYR